MRIKAKYEIKIRANETRILEIIDDLKGFVPLVESKKQKTELFFQMTTREYLEAEQDVIIMLSSTDDPIPDYYPWGELDEDFK